MAPSARILLTVTDKASSTAVAALPPEAILLEESDYVVILAALVCALICVVGLIAAARCACRRRHNSTSGVAGRSSVFSPANKGLKKKVLQALPKITYTTAKSENVTSNPTKLAALSTECAICLGEFVEGDEIRVLPQCVHGFHVVCIDKWLASHSSCPSCRQILVVGRCEKCSDQFPGEASAFTVEQVKASDVNNNAFLP